MSRKIGGQNQDFAVTQPFDDEFEATQPAVTRPSFVDALDDQDRDEPEPRRWVWAGAIVGLAMLGVVSALVWHAWGGSLPALPFVASVTAPGAAPPAAVADKPVGSSDFAAFQQQIAASLQSTAQLVAAQQAEIKRLSDQVSALAAKIDTLQRPAASAQAAIPPAPAAPAPKKKPAAPTPPPAISTGGAPLPQPGR
jgi:uncharacterized coiled-coil protein SlyX